jgi:hypothetical protein
VMVTSDKKLWICEPQTNEWFLYKDRTKKKQDYTITFLLM